MEFESLPRDESDNSELNFRRHMVGPAALYVRHECHTHRTGVITAVVIETVVTDETTETSERLSRAWEGPGDCLVTEAYDVREGTGLVVERVPPRHANHPPHEVGSCCWRLPLSSRPR